MALYLASWGEFNNKLYGLHCTKENIKVCGVKIGNGNSINETWEGIWNKFKNVINLNETRNLRLFGKSIIVNTLVCSKIWYTANVFPVPSFYVDRFNTEMFSFIWNDKTECLKRELLYYPCKQGGINLVNIGLKIQSFLIMHIHQFIFGDYKKWKDIAIYWLKLDVRHYLPIGSISNNMPYNMVKPVFYRSDLLYFQNFIKKFPTLDLHTLSVKKVYNMLLMNTWKPPRIMSIYPNIDFDKAFYNLNNNLLSSENKDVTYSILHHVLPVSEYLYYLKRIVKSPRCVLCNNSAESLSHIFFNCIIVNDI